MAKYASEHKEKYILGDFNIDLQSSKSKSTTFSKKSSSPWIEAVIVTVPTRTEARYVDGTFITPTLIDHIYCSSERMLLL
jgi:hypothetical protein